MKLRSVIRHLPTLLAMLMVALLAAAFETSHAQEIRDTIDQRLKEGWQKKNVSPAPPADDAEFLRRIYLDLVGEIPTYAETKAFLADTAADKRAKLIDKLLADPRFGIKQADVWDDVLFVHNPDDFYTQVRPSFHKFLTESFNKNLPYDQLVRQIMQARGTVAETGTPLYLAQFNRKPEDGATAITQHFLGVQLQCARCHDHPYESWTQRDFYGLAAFLVRLDRVDFKGKSEGGYPEKNFAIGEKNAGEVMFTGSVKEAKAGKKGEPVFPKFLLGEPLKEPEVDKAAKEKGEKEKFSEGKMPDAPKFSRRDKLVDWMVDAKNPFFARAIVNRLWSQYMGRGIIHPVEDMSDVAKASHPELLDSLAKGMIEHKFDLKWLTREIVNSKAYQLSSRGPTEEAMPLLFQRARSRPLSAEELIASWRIATGYDVVVKASPKLSEEAKKSRYYGVTKDYLLRYFGTPSTGTGDFQGGLQEHLYLNHGELPRLYSREAKDGLYFKLLNSKEAWPAKIEQLYISMLNRPPTEAEAAKFLEHLTGEAKPDERLTDAFWALLTSAEFRFNH